MVAGEPWDPERDFLKDRTIMVYWNTEGNSPAERKLLKQCHLRVRGNG